MYAAFKTEAALADVLEAAARSAKDAAGGRVVPELAAAEPAAMEVFASGLSVDATAPSAGPLRPACASPIV